MSDPKRLLAGSANDLASDRGGELGRDLLRSAEVLDVASPDGKSRAYGLIGAFAVGGGATGGAGAGLNGASGSGSAGAATTAKVGGGVASASMAPKAASAGAILFLKWLAVPVAIGAVAVGTHLSTISATSSYAAPPVAQPQIASPQIASPQIASADPIVTPARPAAIPDAPIATPTPALRVAPSTGTSHSRARTTTARGPQTLSMNGVPALPTSAPSSNDVSPNAGGANFDATGFAPTTPIATPLDGVATTTASTANPPPAISASELKEEVASLDRIRDLVRAGRSAEALRALGQYDSRFAGRGLVQESTVVRIEALEKSGDRAAAASLARQFLADNPTSSHADAVRALLARATSSSP